MWLLPLLVLGAIVVAATSRSPREMSLVPQPPPPGPLGPIATLGEYARGRQTPPPMVILCAIAEAEALGREDVASDIVRAFVAPVVYQHDLMNARFVAPPAHPVPYQRGGSCAPALQAPATDEEIRAMLNTDPQKFVAMAQRGVIDVPVTPSPEVSAQPMGLPSETVAQMQESAGLHEAADQTRALAPGSPIPEVTDEDWRQFVMRLEREPVTLASSRHVGQYRQRRERLAELGIDSSAIHGSAQAQRAALDTDLADAHHHATAAGLISEHLGRTIALPGHEVPATISLSGVLGVIQCAGLEGAVGWFESPSDRKRYPHTTQAFLRTNEVF